MEDNNKNLNTASLLQLGSIVVLVYVGVKLFNLKFNTKSGDWDCAKVDYFPNIFVDPAIEIGFYIFSVICVPYFKKENKV